MTDNEQLVKALRCGEYKPECGSSDCPYWSGLGCMDGQLMEDAAAAIEALQARVSKLGERTKAQQERLEDYMEKQTYIDHYGDKWMTSAKDVPTAAYEHGYADGRGEAEAQLSKRDEIVLCRECKWYQPDLFANPWGVCFHEDWVANNIGHTVDEDGFCYRGEREVQG